MARRQLRQPQRGAALLIFLILLITAALTYVVNSFTPEMIEARRQQKTQEALVQARDALLGYALLYRDQKAAQDPSVPDAMLGHLPLPDFGESVNLNHNLVNQTCISEGCAMINPANLPAGIAIGRFPWKTVGTGPLRDGHGECLWYAVSTSHRGVDPTATIMNWDTLATPDILIGSGLADLNAINAHDRPVAVIFSPGPAFDSGRTQSADAPLCGGNYTAAHYVDPALNNAQPAQAVSSERLFGMLRKHAHFRTDIDTMLNRMVGCLRDQFQISGKKFYPDAIAGFVVPSDKSAGKIPDDDIDNDGISNSSDPDFPADGISNASTCFDNLQNPKGYFNNYKEMIFVGKPSTGNFTVNGDSSCAGVVIFSGQRDMRNPRCPRDTPVQPQKRVDPNIDKNSPCNYLEGTNLSSFEAVGDAFSGSILFDRSPPQAQYDDIVLCVPNSKSLVEVDSPGLPEGKELTNYAPDTRTLTLGQLGVSEDDYPPASLYGCSWTPEIHTTASGFRSYFSFNIENSGEGFVFAAVDGTNSLGACGASRQHLGYSGNNGASTILPPKIGIEIDTSKQTGSYLIDDNNRADPDYAGGHAAIVYWGDESTSEDDNVHGLPEPVAPMPPRHPPRNPPVPASVTQDGAGVARLDSSSVSNLLGKNIHVRVEVALTSSNLALHSRTYHVDVWIKKGDSDTNIISAMKNTTRPIAMLYPTINTAAFLHLHDEPTFFDARGSACSIDTPCSTGLCATDGYCYTELFRTIRLGFTNSQGTADKDQLIRIKDFVTTWLP